MLNNASGFRKVYIAAGYTDLRRGIDGLASIVLLPVIQICGAALTGWHPL